MALVELFPEAIQITQHFLVH
uniref:Uncharacterized protein n=1 Tax=Rhizophora mucronata TaxID=61149 RepID=A0A2P2J935_RHIMU